MGPTTMWRRAWIPAVLASLLAAACLAGAQENHGQSNHNDVPLSLAEIRALVARAIADQHADDRELDEYDRTEHSIKRDSGKNGAAVETVERVVPTGTGDVRVELARNGKPVDAMSIEQAWRDIEKALAARSNPDDPAIKPEYERAAERNRAHEEMVDAVGSAFRYQWAGRVTRDGRPMIELAFEPAGTYKSSARYAGIFAHTGGLVWLDESSGQVARVEAQLRDDVPFVAGLFGKIYRGSQVTIEQAEVAPGVWFPVVATYDIEGRKFLFAESMHGQIDASGYRHLGRPAEALPLVRREHGGVISSER